MKIGIFTYGTRGDLQPYIALALGLMNNGHQVTISATEDFKNYVESYGISFQALWGNAEQMMMSNEGQRIIATGNSIQLMKYYFKVLHDNRHALRKSYYQAISKVDVVIANSMTLPIVSAIVEKLHKKIALTYFMPPIVPTREFPLSDFDFFNFPIYNKLTYKLAQGFFWKFVKQDTNEYRKELGLPILKENLVTYLDKQQILDLYCISPSLISPPKDWQPHHKITGFIYLEEKQRIQHENEQLPQELHAWLSNGEKPIYMGFGSNRVACSEQIEGILSQILQQTQERILFCTGWATYDNLTIHQNLFIIKDVNHEAVLSFCKLGIFHGGAGTLATMLRHNLPLIVISFYTDQPTWGKIVQRNKLGLHLPIKTLTGDKLISGISQVQHEIIKQNVASLGYKLRHENGLENAIKELEHYLGSGLA